MQFTGIIKTIGEVKTFTNAQTGAQYTKRDIVLVKAENYYTREGEQKERENAFVFELSDTLAQNFSLPEGTKVEIRYSSNVRQYGTNYYETKRVFNLQLS